MINKEYNIVYDYNGEIIKDLCNTIGTIIILIIMCFKKGYKLISIKECEFAE